MPVGVGGAVGEGDSEGVAAGVDGVLAVSVESVDGGGEALLVVVEGRQPAGQSALRLGVVGGEPRESGELAGDFGLFADQRVAGGDRFDLGVGQDHFGVEVLDRAGCFVRVGRGHDLGDEPGLAFQGLPHVRVEGAVGDVADDVHDPVLVAVTQDAAFALFDVGGPPRASR